MKKNLGTADRIIRVLLAIAAAVLFFTDTVTGWVGITLMSVATIFVLTSLVSFCPIYAIFGAKTCKTS